MLIRKQQVLDARDAYEACFNPSYSGCWFGSNHVKRKKASRHLVSILLILDVDSEVTLFLRCYIFRILFQSFLFWMLIRKVSSSLSSKTWFSGFNPSYSGCWFGSGQSVGWRGIITMFQSFLFWMLIRKYFSHLYFGLFNCCFNPSYSGCWFGS